MEQLNYAFLENGERIPFLERTDPPRGGMKYTFFAPDKSYVVQFFHDPGVGEDPHVRARLAAILGRYNPTLAEDKGGAIGNTEQIAAYFQKLFCWPLAIVKEPAFGIVCPTYPKNFFFDSSASNILNLNGKEKKSNWYLSQKTRQYINPQELGDYKTLFRLCIMLARVVRRLHQAGLAHSDLSNNNVLIDPKSGSCVVIDIDSLVVPGIFPPEVIGTRGYIAPEVLESLTYPPRHPMRRSPSVLTDLHALPVLLYEYLFLRHPLLGPKRYSKRSEGENDFLALGPKATFIEHPEDFSNRPQHLRGTIQDLGPILEDLFLRAFVLGLQEPKERPTAMEWERGLVRTWDLLYPCPNPRCEQKWFVLHDKENPVCPFCGSRLKNCELNWLSFRSEMRGQIGAWLLQSEMNLYDQAPLFLWHLQSNIFPDEKADKEMRAYVSKQQDRWLFTNISGGGMIAPDGRLIPSGQSFPIQAGDTIHLSLQERGMIAEVHKKIL